MKSKVWKHAISLLCVVALVASLGIAAWAADELTLEDVAAMAQKALDQQEIQNIMSRHVMYHCYGEHQEELEEIWVTEYANQLTASFGQNQGFYVGYGSIWEAYVDGHNETWLASAKSYCENNGIDITGWTDEEILEIYGGVGQLLLHVTTTAIIEVAEDGLTAKGFWYSPGMIAESGSSANTIWEAYGVDFIKEDGEWKIWHLHMYTDFMGSYYLELGGSTTSTSTASVSVSASGEASGDASGEIADTTAEESTSTTTEQGDYTTVDTFLLFDYVSSAQYSEFSSSRLRSEMESIPIPLAYESFSFSDSNFCPTIEEYASVGIDVNVWYEAHGYTVE